MRTGNWSEQAYLKASNAELGDRFGFSVAVSGHKAVVGARLENSATTGVNSSPNNNASSSGAAYVFSRSATTWSQERHLKALNTVMGAVFGAAVAVSGDTIVIGSPSESSIAVGSGAAYVFAPIPEPGNYSSYPPRQEALSISELLL